MFVQHRSLSGHQLDHPFEGDRPAAIYDDDKWPLPTRVGIILGLSVLCWLPIVAIGLWLF